MLDIHPEPVFPPLLSMFEEKSGFPVAAMFPAMRVQQVCVSIQSSVRVLNGERGYTLMLRVCMSLLMGMSVYIYTCICVCVYIYTCVCV